MRRVISFFMSIAILFSVLVTPAQAVIVTSTALLYGGAAVVALALGVLGLRQTGTDQALSDYCQEIFDSDAVQMAAGILGFSAAYASGWLPILMQRDVTQVTQPDGSVVQDTVTKTYIPEQVLTAIANEAISTGAYLDKTGSGVFPSIPTGYSYVPNPETLPDLNGTRYPATHTSYVSGAFANTINLYDVYYSQLVERMSTSSSGFQRRLSEHLMNMYSEFLVQYHNKGYTDSQPITLSYSAGSLGDDGLYIVWTVTDPLASPASFGFSRLSDSYLENVNFNYAGRYFTGYADTQVENAVIGEYLPNGVYVWYDESGNRYPFYLCGLKTHYEDRIYRDRFRIEYQNGVYTYKPYTASSTYGGASVRLFLESSCDLSIFYPNYVVSSSGTPEVRTAVIGIEGGTASPSIDIPIDVQIGVTTENPIGDDVINSLDELVGKIDGWSDYLDKGVSIPLEGTGAATGATTVDETLGLEIDIPIDSTGAVPGVIDKPQDITGAQDGTVSDVTDLVDSSANVTENQDVVEQFVDWMEGYIALDTSIFRKFPLSIIYDVYAFFSVVATGTAPGVSGVMDATPGTLPSVSGGTTAQQPVIEIPIKYGEFFDTELSIDLTDYEQTIAFIRTTEGAVFMLALIWYELNRRKE